MGSHEKDELERALAGLDYPAPRNKLIEVAKINNASAHVIERLLELSETADFQDESELHESLGIDVPGNRPEGGWQ
jgi:hypothetical protein